MSVFDSVRRFLELPGRNRKQPDVRLDAGIFHNLCHTLRAEAPGNAILLIMDAVLPDETEDCDLNCRAQKASGKNAGFTPSPEGKEQICAWLHELRDSMVEQSQPRWTGMKLTVDVAADKYTADFRY